MLRTSKFSAVLIALFISVGAMAQSATGPTSTTSTQSGASEGVKDTPAGVSENGSKMKMKKMSKADRKAMKAKRKGAMSDSSMQKETTGAGGTTASP
jgi:hypothetical protein